MLRAYACARRPGARTKNWCSSDKKESVAEYPGRKIRFSELFIWYKKEDAVGIQINVLRERKEKKRKEKRK